MTITAYGALHAIGVAAGIATLFACAERSGIGAVRAAKLIFISFAAAFAVTWLAGRLVASPGSSRHGGGWSGLAFPATLFGGWLLARLGRLPLSFVDSAAVALPPALVLGRAGCLAAGCCGGVRIESAAWLRAVRAVQGPAAAGHPTQVYDAVLLAAAAPLVLLAFRRGAPGMATAVFLAAFGASRLFTSALRTGFPDVAFGLNADQCAGAFAIVLSVPVALAARRTRAQRATGTTADRDSRTSAP